MNILNFYQKKYRTEKISMMTCYDYTSARMLAETEIDCLLVGDTVAMIVHGFKDTLSATLEMMCIHTAAVSRGAGNKFVLGDMPFLSYRMSLSKSMKAAQQLMQAGAHGIKLESASGNIKLIQHLTESGIPVMGHVGLIPQSIYLLGGFKVQGKTEESANYIKESAQALQEAGCFAIVLECIPSQLAKEITQMLTIPTIGIGAGPFTDGQVLVFQDLLGLQKELNPKFVKRFANGYDYLKTGVESYINSVKLGEYPQDKHCY